MDTPLLIECFDFDGVGSNELIGKTKVYLVAYNPSRYLCFISYFCHNNQDYAGEIILLERIASDQLRYSERKEASLSKLWYISISNHRLIHFDIYYLSLLF